MSRIFFFTLIAFIFLQVIFAIKPTTEKIKIGFVASLSGPLAHLGIEMKQAAIDSVKVINANGGLLDKEVELIIRDDECNLDRARWIAEEFARDYQISAVIGHCPNLGPGVANIYHNSQKIFISMLTSNRDFGFSSFRFVYRLGISEDRLAKAAANTIVDKINSGVFQGSKVGIVRDDSQFGRNTADILRQELYAKYINVTFEQEIFDPDEFKLLWEANYPDILFFSVSDPTFIKNLLGNDPPPASIITVGMPFTPDYLWEEFYEWSEETKTEAFVIAPSVNKFVKPLSPIQFDVLKLWNERVIQTSKLPSIQQIYVFTAFDLLVQAITKAGSTSAFSLEPAIRSFQGQSTLLGDLRSGETGEIKPIPFNMYSQYEMWTPSSASQIEYRFGQREMAARDNGEPEYNIEIEPKQQREPLVLIPNNETKVTFYIGPRSDESLTPGMEPSDILKAIADGKPLDLTVTLFCNISKENTYQQRKIRYDPNRDRSNSAEFLILPSLAAVHDNHGLGKLIFVVDANGMEIDVIQLDAIVGDPSQEALNKYTPPVKLALDRLLPEEISVPDLIVAFAPSEGNVAIPVIIRPIHKELRKTLQDVLGDPDKEFWIFKSGVTATDLGSRVANTYKALLSLIDQHHQELQRVYQRIGADTDLSSGTARLYFKKEDTKKILETTGTKGALLYWNIFHLGDEGLFKAMKAIDSFNLDRPLRLRILAENIYAPWQILYTDNELQKPIDPKLFWGFRYELGTLQLVNTAQGRMRTILGKLEPDEVIFGAWRGISQDDVKDEVRERADMLKNHLETNIGDDIAYCLSKEVFISKIKSGANTIKLIVAYGHGSSGTELIAATLRSGEPVVIDVTNVIGPYFKFSEGANETLIPEDIDELAMLAHRDKFLRSQPIIILNACETGTSGTRTADNNGFVGAMTRAGARAVIVTEAPVWANFAHQFGTDLIELLLEGKEARTALLETRLKHLEKAGNPFGLIYSLYGNPAARIKKE